MSKRDSDGRPILTRFNWSWWESEIQPWLSSKGLWRYAKGAVTEPKPKDATAVTDAEYRTQEEYQQRLEKAAGELWLAMEEPLRPQFKGKRSTPKDLYDAMKAAFNIQEAGTRFAALSDFFDVNLGDDAEATTALTDLLSRVDEAMTRVQSLRPSTGYDLDKMDLELKAMVTMRALAASPNPQHANMYTSLLLDKALTYETVKEMIAREFASHRMTADGTPLAANRAGYTPECYNCKGPHLIRDCPKFKPDWKKEEEAAAAASTSKRQGKKKKGGANASGASSAPSAPSDASSTASTSAAAARVESAGQASAFTSSPALKEWLQSKAAANFNTDTGASLHMTPRRDWFVTYSPHRVPVRLANGAIVYSAGIGSVEYQPVDGEKALMPIVFFDVLHVPLLTSNLLSIYHLTAHKGYEVSIKDKRVAFYRAGALVCTATVDDSNTGYLDGYVVVPPAHSAQRAASTTLPLDAALWHRRFAHVNHGDIAKLRQRKLVRGMRFESKEAPDPICEPCIMGKQTRKAVPRGPGERATRPLELVHTDLKGPMPVASREGANLYWITFIDDKTRRRWVAYLKRKSDAWAAIQQFKAAAEVESGQRLEVLRCDGGGEYISNVMKDAALKEGWRLEITEPDEPHQNGVAERANLTLANGASSMLYEAKLPPSFWAYAIAAYNHVANRAPTSALPGDTTPHIAWTGKTPDVSYFRVFGCLSYVLVKDKHRRALEPHSQKCIFLGYPPGTKAWLFYNPATKKTVISSHAVFDERYMPGTSLKSLNLITAEIIDRGEGPPDFGDVADQGGDVPSPSTHRHSADDDGVALYDDQPPSPAPAAPAAPQLRTPPPTSPPAPSTPLQQPAEQPTTPPSARPPPPSTPQPSRTAPPSQAALRGRQQRASQQQQAPPRPRSPSPPWETVRPSTSSGPSQSRLPRATKPTHSLSERNLTSRAWQKQAAPPSTGRASSSAPAPPPQVTSPNRFAPLSSGLEEVEEQEEQEQEEQSEQGVQEERRERVQEDDAQDRAEARRRMMDWSGSEDELRITDETPIPGAHVLQAGLDYVFSGITQEDWSVEQALDFALATTVAPDPQQGEPKTFAEALLRPDKAKWIEAAFDEVQALVDNGTFEVVELPPGKRAIGSRWVFKVKRNADGSIERYKARCVAQGFSQRPGFEYTETFAPTPKWAAIRAILALAAMDDLVLYSIDISNAFLNGALAEEIYMRQPPGFKLGVDPDKDYVWRLKKSLYGLKQASHVWHETLNKVLVEMGFTRILCDHSVWVYGRGDARILVPVFVDDMTIGCKTDAQALGIIGELKKHFKLRELGPTTWLLGVAIERERSQRTLSLSQRQYAVDVLERFGMADCHPVTTPLDPSHKLSAADAPVTPEDIEFMSTRAKEYASAVGAIAWLALATRPDLAYPVSVLARFTGNPGRSHWRALMHLFRYLKGTLDYKLTYDGKAVNARSELFYTYTDADHGGNPDNGRSTSGQIVMMAGGAVSWSSKLQTIVALSTTEAEYVAACSAGQEILWMRNFLTECGYSVKGAPSTLYIDNNSALQVAKNPEHHGRMKHLDLRFYWLRDEVHRGSIRLVHLQTADMPADMLTKALGRVKLQHMAALSGLGVGR